MKFDRTITSILNKKVKGVWVLLGAVETLLSSKLIIDWLMIVVKVCVCGDVNWLVFRYLLCLGLIIF